MTALNFRGAGWGHGVGMCQLGAIGRAEAGHGYREILSHYYNGASVRALYGEAQLLSDVVREPPALADAPKTR